ncbi:DUF4082 domain-containing protein [Microlunatus soli]|uniref:Ig-like domain-containing protein n=1 Tax=Microlunatus soli TaxID=630515 RepID=A0A1H1SPL2_9ACTN|nr:DUF4082 domain-containing protein [Microlunatus soli]SDS49851.1 Ig-like domain-containing protein [Microlunatus soli]
MTNRTDGRSRPGSDGRQGTDARRWTFSRRRLLGSAGLAAAAGSAWPGLRPSTAAAAGETNSIEQENALPGNDQDEWGSWNRDSIQGYTTKYSYLPGETVKFKVKTDSANWRIRIYRMGWYGGAGARRFDDVTPSVPLPQRQPDNPILQADVLLKDYGNWAVSASWTIPTNAVSGVYYALLERLDNDDSNHCIFVVRRNGPSDILVQTSDMTWQAYNMYGDNSLYFSEQGATLGRAYKVSYNRPIFGGGIENMFLGSEVPLVRFLERNGYDVSYCGGVDVHQDGTLLLNHKIFISSGHDEYVSGPQRSHVTSARDAGVNMIFMTGNEYFWRVRFEPSIDGSNTADRTLVCYKETLDGARLDPTSEWTGTWADPRFTPPAVGGNHPQNDLTGQFFRVILPTGQPDDTITVPAEYAPLRFWRNTAVANLTTGQSRSLAPSTLGYEFDCDEDNGYRPPGSIRLSSTTVTVPQILRDYGGTYSAGSTTHNMTLYRASSGALVWGTGTVQWAYGLDDYHEADQGTATDAAMQQATVNVLADMGVQPSTLMSSLTAAHKSTDTTGPTVTISSPVDGSTFPIGTAVTITGTAQDADGVVAAVEISIDDGASWHPITGRSSWSHVFTLMTTGTNSIKVRGIDDSCNIGTPTTLNLVAGPREFPCSIWPDSILPAVTSSDDAGSIEVGVKFRSNKAGFVTGLKFYKGSGNTGTHVGHLWSSTGTSLAQATFDNETTAGWQTVTIPSVPVGADKTYIASVYMPVGNYAADAGYFGQAFALDPLRALADGDDGPNGVYRYGSSGFPSQSFGATNYWVDVVFTTHDANPPRVVDSTPAPGVSAVNVKEPITLTFGAGVTASSISCELRSAAGAAVSGATAYDPDTLTMAFTPAADLDPLTEYTFTLSAATNADGVPLTDPVKINFTTIGATGSYPTSIWDSAARPAVIADDDTSAVELGVRFRSDIDGSITALRYYKAPGSPGGHIGHLWSATGELLSTVAFGTETLGGWQQATLSTAVEITADTVYTVSYYCPNGVYGATSGAFLGGGIDRGVLHALANSDGGNGVFQYGVSSFPSSTAGGANYLADIVFVAAPDHTAPTVSSVFPAKDLIAVDTAAKPTAQFSEPIDPNSLAFSLRRADGVVINGSAAYDAASQVATFTPGARLDQGKKYTATVTATDTAGNALADPVSWSFTTVQPMGTTPVTLWDTSSVPQTTAVDDSTAIEVGCWITSSTAGKINGVRFYKGIPNTGDHEGHLWSAAGTLLGSAKFSQESSSGWQQAMFDSPITIDADTPYVVSYHAPKGGYAHTGGGLNNSVSSGPLTAPASSSDRPNGVYRYGAAAFPTSSYNAANYWVDAIFADTVGAQVTDTTPTDGKTGVDRLPMITATFSDPVVASSIVMRLRDAGGGLISGDVSYDASTQRARFTPASALTLGAVYTASVEEATDTAGNPLSAKKSWSFTVIGLDAQTLWPTSTTPAQLLDSSSDPTELGVKFRSAIAGQINGIRFYKGGPTAQGPHSVSLWSASGSRLGTVPVASESARGWQVAMFADPIPIEADTTYVASYFAPNGHTSYDSGYFATDWTRGDLTAPKNGGSSGPNGVYAESTTSTFPDRSGGGTNYWVDVLFTTA